MTIDTYFNFGDEVWTIRDCKVKHFEVVSIVVSKDDDGKPKVAYFGAGMNEYANEDNAFSDRETLIKSLMDE